MSFAETIDTGFPVVRRHFELVGISAIAGPGGSAVLRYA